MQNTQERAHSKGIALTTAASLMWGTVFVSISYGLRYLGPYSLVFMRFVVASIPILVLMLIFERRIHVLRELSKKSNWALGVVYSLGFLLQFEGQSLANASDATLLSNLASVLAPIAAFAFLKDRITAPQKIAVPLGLLGLVLIAGPKMSLGASDFTGDLLLFTASITLAVFIIMSKKMNFGSLGSSFALILIITVILSPVALLTGFTPAALTSLNLFGWASILWMSIPCTVISIVLYLKGLSGISVSESAILLLIQVLVGLVLAFLLLGEALSAYEILGAFIIAGAVALSSLHINSGRSSEAPRNISTEK